MKSPVFMNKQQYDLWCETVHVRARFEPQNYPCIVTAIYCNPGFEVQEVIYYGDFQAARYRITEGTKDGY